MKEYKLVDINSYVMNGIENGTMFPRVAVKFARVIARQGIVGETVISWSVDSQGNEIKERTDQVRLDEITNNPGWVLTKLDEQGNIIIDINGHPNQWINSDRVFHNRYEVDPENPSLFKSKAGPQIFVQITENIIFNLDEKNMEIAAGGYINITDHDKMYGVSLRDFEDTYRFIDELEKKVPRL